MQGGRYDHGYDLRVVPPEGANAYKPVDDAVVSATRTGRHVAIEDPHEPRAATSMTAPRPLAGITEVLEHRVPLRELRDDVIVHFLVDDRWCPGRRRVGSRCRVRQLKHDDSGGSCEHHAGRDLGYSPPPARAIAPALNLLLGSSKTVRQRLASATIACDSCMINL